MQTISPCFGKFDLSHTYSYFDFLSLIHLCLHVCLVPPDIQTQERPFRHYNVTVGKPVVLECDAQGDPPPEVIRKLVFLLVHLYLPLKCIVAVCKGYIYKKEILQVIWSHQGSQLEPSSRLQMLEEGHILFFTSIEV